MEFTLRQGIVVLIKLLGANFASTDRSGDFDAKKKGSH